MKRAIIDDAIDQLHVVRDLTWLLLGRLIDLRRTDAESLRASASGSNVLFAALTTLATILATASNSVHVLHVTSDKIRSVVLGASGPHPRSILLAIGAPDAEEAADSDSADMLLKSRTTALLTAGESLTILARRVARAFETATALLLAQNRLRLECLIIVVACIGSVLIALIDRDVGIDTLLLEQDSGAIVINLLRLKVGVVAEVG